MCPGPLTIPAYFIKVLIVTYSWNFSCSEASRSLQNKAWVCLWVSTVHGRDSAWMALNKFGSFFPMLSSRLSQKALCIHSCPYAAPQGIQCTPSVACHKNKTLVDSRCQLKCSSQLEWKNIAKDNKWEHNDEKNALLATITSFSILSLAGALGDAIQGAHLDPVAHSPRASSASEEYPQWVIRDIRGYILAGLYLLIDLLSVNLPNLFLKLPALSIYLHNSLSRRSPHYM